MSSLTRMIAGLALAAGLVLSTTAANAAPANAQTNANIRSGPGTGHAIVGTLKKGAYVIVVDCSVNWCLIHRVGTDGYVSRKLLINPYYSTGAWKGYEFAPKHPAPGR
jgi:uncharacterized protein YraI